MNSLQLMKVSGRFLLGEFLCKIQEVVERKKHKYIIYRYKCCLNGNCELREELKTDINESNELQIKDLQAYIKF